MGIEIPISRPIERTIERDIHIGVVTGGGGTEPDGVLLDAENNFMIFADGDYAAYTE